MAIRMPRTRRYMRRREPRSARNLLKSCRTDTIRRQVRRGNVCPGGEKQRIAIARMILKNAPVVILDEATAYIDPENEAVIQKAIAKLVQGKTVIVIAHRLSTIKDADKIVVVKDGDVA